jgi:hypothetical protein
MKQLYYKDTYLAAVHEAAHSTLNLVLGIPMEYAEVTEFTKGWNIYVSGYSQNVSHEETMKDMTEIEKKRYIALWWVSVAAGIAVERILGGPKRKKQWAADIHQLKTIVKNVNVDVNIPIDIVVILFSEYPSICKAHSIIVEKLLTQKRIEGAELQKIVDSEVTQEEKTEIKHKIWHKLRV